MPWGLHGYTGITDWAVQRAGAVPRDHLQRAEFVSEDPSISAFVSREQALPLCADIDLAMMRSELHASYLNHHSASQE